MSFRYFCFLSSLQSVIESELLDNLKIFDFSLDDSDMKSIKGLDQNLRKIDPIKTLASGEVILRDKTSKNYAFDYVEKLDDEE